MSAVAVGAERPRRGPSMRNGKLTLRLGAVATAVIVLLALGLAVLMAPREPAITLTVSGTLSISPVLEFLSVRS